MLEDIQSYGEKVEWDKEEKYGMVLYLKEERQANVQETWTSLRHET